MAPALQGMRHGHSREGSQASSHLRDSTSPPATRGCLTAGGSPRSGNCSFPPASSSREAPTRQGGAALGIAVHRSQHLLRVLGEDDDGDGALVSGERWQQWIIPRRALLCLFICLLVCALIVQGAVQSGTQSFSCKPAYATLAGSQQPAWRGGGGATAASAPLIAVVSMHDTRKVRASQRALL
jgi:hypothetical protein